MARFTTAFDSASVPDARTLYRVRLAVCYPGQDVFELVRYLGSVAELKSLEAVCADSGGVKRIAGVRVYELSNVRPHDAQHGG